MVSGHTLVSRKWGVGSREEPPQRRKGPAQFRDDKLLEPVTRSVVDVIALAEVAYANGDVGHILESGEW